MKRAPIRRRSKKMQKVYQEERVPLVKAILANRTDCERCKQARSREVHEVRMRSSGGSITDPTNCRALCVTCHRWIHAHPKESREQGWLVGRFSN